MSEKINLAFIGTYPEISKIFMKITSEMDDVYARSIDASFEKAVEQAKALQPGCEAILSRGGTAEYIKNAVNIPVITIPITPFDVVRALHVLTENVKEVALIHFKKYVLSIGEIENLYQMKIHEYLFTDYGDIEHSVRDAWKQGIRVVIGGEVAARIAREYGMEGIVISAGYEAVARAIDETRQVLDEKRKEQNKSVQLAAAFSALVEGIIVLDEEKRVVIYNPAAKKIFQRQYGIGESVQEDVFDENCRRIYEERERAGETNGLRRMGDGIYTFSHSPIKMGGKFVGMVSRYEDVTKVQKLEQQIRKEIHAKGFVAKYCFFDILGESAEIRETVEMACIYAKVDSSILIEGESGTGKEFFAQSIHNESMRKHGPFVAVNCTAIPENLLESELFGYEPGAFTGAKKEGKAGLFELAHGGTLFLDEIGEITEPVQARLLRVLQEREIMRVGGDKIIPINVRIISATNRNLWQRTKEGAFRIDLYYRLNIFHLDIPPLRVRKGDIPVLCGEFAGRMRAELDQRFYSAVLPRLEQYTWPGNVRELESVMERYSLLSTLWAQGKISEAQIDALLGVAAHEEDRGTLRFPGGSDLKEMVDNVELEIIDYILESCNHNQTEAARRLGIGRTTLWRKMRQGMEEEGVDHEI